MPPVQIHYVLFASNEVKDVRARFKAACNGTIEILAAEDDPCKSGVWIESQSTTTHPLPSPQVLAHFGRGFDAKSAAAFSQSKAALSITGVGPFDAQHKLLRELTTTVSRLSRELNAFVFDAADWLTFTPQAFHNLRSAEIENGQLSSAQFAVRAYRVEGGIRSVSMGLEKFGQPDFCLPLFSEHHMPMMDRMMTLAIQHMIESEIPIGPGPMMLNILQIRSSRLKQELIVAQQPNAIGEATLRLQTVPSEKGDPENLLAPVFKSSTGPQLWEEQANLLNQLFGRDRHVSNNVDMGEIIQEAIEKARQRAMEILSDSKTWQREGRRLRVAAGLPKVNEVVWLEVTSWNNGRGTGILLSQPQHVPDLNSGDTVSFSMDTLMDYRLSNPEGELESGGVDELVQRCQSG